MDRKLQYNVWMRKGNSWEAVLKTEVSQLTAETLAVMMAQERYLPYTDERFCVSAGRPSSGGFENKAVSINGFIIEEGADKAIRHAVKFERSVDTFSPGIERFHLLQSAGLVNHQGFPTSEGIRYVETHPKQS